MTKITFTKKNNYIVKMQISGHTGFAVSGEDVLCAAISAISQAVVMGIQQVLKCPNCFKRDFKKGFLSISVLTEDKSILDKTNILFETALIAFNDIQFENEKFMKVEVCDEIY